MSDLETRYKITIRDNQFIKHRYFFIKGYYTPDSKQDIHVYKHREETDCYIVYKENRMLALRADNWEDHQKVWSIVDFDKSKYEYIFGVKLKKILIDFNLLQPLWYLGIANLQEAMDNIEYICPMELRALQCHCSITSTSLFV